MVSHCIENKDTTTEPVQKKPASTHVLSVGVVMVSVLILSIGLIMGMEFPKFVYRRMISDQCITNKDHKYFHQWKLEEDTVRYKKIYYWVIKNAKDVLLSGMDPIVEEVGPYIYREKRMKKDITFSGAKVSFSYDTLHTFDVQRTYDECGENCREEDELTVIQPYNLIRVYRANGIPNFVFTSLAKTVREHINIWNSDEDKNATLRIYQYLGCFSFLCAANSFSNMTSIPAFGPWILRNDTYYKQNFLINQNMTAFISLPEITLFYQWLTKDSVFFNTALFESCQTSFEKIISENDNDIYNFTANMELFNISSLNFTFIKDFQTACGLLFILKMLNEKNIALEDNPIVTSLLLMYFCESNANECHKKLDLEEMMVIGYLMKDFVLNEMFQYAYSLVREYLKSTIVKPLKQRDLARGYRDSSAMYVRGILQESHVCNGNQSVIDIEWTLWTCLKDRDVTNNFVTADFHTTCEDGTLDVVQSKRTGHTEYVSAPVLCQACKSPQIQQNRYDIFIEPLYGLYTFSSETTAEMDGHNVHQLFLSQDEYSLFKDGCSCALRHTGDLKLYKSVYSNPHFFGCSSSPFRTNGVNKKNTLSYILVEPISGKIWKKVIRLQENIHIPVLDNGTIERDVLLPYYWREDIVEITSAGIEHFNYKVTRLLRAACGGLVGLSTISGLVLILSIVILVFPRRLNRVTPAPVEEAVPGRHYNLAQR